ncbi:Brp/Blh family beta-carotene 15,15'-dioxygenase [Flavobacteriaceae bacterium M23B6Z8]
MAYLLIFSFGILHGANDIKLVQKLQRGQKSFTFFKTLLYYILIVGLGVVLFYYLPLLGLLVFVLFSGYHFGEQHWESVFSKSGILRTWAFLSYGLLILFLLFFTNANQVSLIIEDMTGITLKSDFYTYGLIISLCLFIIFSSNIISYRKHYKLIIKETFYLIVFFVVFQTASLLWGFTIYFILWHSLPSLIDQILYLYGSLTKRNMWLYFKSSALNWIVSLLGLVILYAIFNSREQLFLSIFFSFLAAITFPHVLVMSKLKK